MSRYIISQSQLFDLVENFMSEQMAGGEVRKRDTDDYGNTRWDLYSKSGKFLMYYIHYGEKQLRMNQVIYHYNTVWYLCS